MSGDWIKMRVDLREDPAVFRLAKLTGLDRLSVVGRLWAFWAWADRHAVDGLVIGADADDVDQVADHAGFAAAMVAVGWLEAGGDGVKIPRHDRHSAESAKERALKNARQAKWRAGRATVDAPPPTKPKRAPSTPPSTPPPHVDAAPSTGASTREEKRREEEKENPPNPPSQGSGGEPGDAKRERKRKPALSLKAWLQRCGELGELAIPADDPVFGYCDTVGIDRNLLELHWREFKRRRSEADKRQADWRRTFRNSVEGNWYRLWFIGPSGQAELTTQGRQARALLEASREPEQQQPVRELRELRLVAQQQACA